MLLSICRRFRPLVAFLSSCLPLHLAAANRVAECVLSIRVCTVILYPRCSWSLGLSARLCARLSIICDIFSEICAISMECDSLQMNGVCLTLHRKICCKYVNSSETRARKFSYLLSGVGSSRMVLEVEDIIRGQKIVALALAFSQ